MAWFWVRSHEWFILMQTSDLLSVPQEDTHTLYLSCCLISRDTRHVPNVPERSLDGTSRPTHFTFRIPTNQHGPQSGLNDVTGTQSTCLN
jgi:hypothetical protein